MNEAEVSAMLNRESGDRIELFYEISPGSDNSRTVNCLLRSERRIGLV